MKTLLLTILAAGCAFGATINVLSCGGNSATGNGSTNDAAKLNACIATASPGDTVLFPAPSVDYYIGASTVTLKTGTAANPITYHGAAQSVSIRGDYTSTATVFNLPVGFNGITIDNLTFRGGGAQVASPGHNSSDLPGFETNLIITNSIFRDNININLNTSGNPNYYGVLYLSEVSHVKVQFNQFINIWENGTVGPDTPGGICRVQTGKTCPQGNNVAPFRTDTWNPPYRCAIWAKHASDWLVDSNTVDSVEQFGCEYYDAVTKPTSGYFGPVTWTNNDIRRLQRIGVEIQSQVSTGHQAGGPLVTDVENNVEYDWVYPGFGSFGWSIVPTQGGATTVNGNVTIAGPTATGAGSRYAMCIELSGHNSVDAHNNICRGLNQTTNGWIFPFAAIWGANYAITNNTTCGGAPEGSPTYVNIEMGSTPGGSFSTTPNNGGSAPTWGSYAACTTITPVLISVTGITTTAATISWTTSNVPSNSRVDYGTTNSYGTNVSSATIVTRTHTMSLSGLSPGTLYHYKLTSVDTLSFSGASADLTFTTLGSMPTPGVAIYSRQLTVDHTKVPNTDQTNFPVMFRSAVGNVTCSGATITVTTGDNLPSWLDTIDLGGTTYPFIWTDATHGTATGLSGCGGGTTYSSTPYFKTLANGGLVQNLTTQGSMSVPADVFLTSDLSCSTLLPFEIESYSATTGAIIIWYNQMLSHTSDTAATACYDSLGTTGYLGNVNGVWNNGFKFVSHMGDLTTSTIADSTSNALTLTKTGAGSPAVTTAGQIGPAQTYSSSSSGNYARNASASAATVGNQMTISTWFKSTSTSTTQDLIHKGDQAGGPFLEYGLGLTSSGKGQISNNNGCSTATNVSTVSSYSANTWTHLSGTWDGTTQRIYLNGVQNNTGALSGTTCATTNQLNTGVSSVFTTEKFDGTLDEIHISNVVRSADWLLTEVNNQGSPLAFGSVGSQTVVAGGPLLALSGASAATGMLSNFPLGSFRWSMRFHGLPTTSTGSDRVLAKINTTAGGAYIQVYIPANTLNISVVDSLNGQPNGLPTIPLGGRTDVRIVITKQKDATYGQTRVDTWAGNCSASSYVWSNIPSPDQGTEPANSSQAFLLGGNNIAVDFFRADAFPAGGIGKTPTCPADVLPSPAAFMDFRFDNSTTADLSPLLNMLSPSGQSFPTSTSYNPGIQIVGSWTAPRPVVRQVAFTMDGSQSVTSDGNAGPTTYTWSRVSGPAVTFSTTNTPVTTVTPMADGSLVLRLVAVDANGLSSTLDYNVGVVNTDANGIKIQANAELGWIEGNIARFGEPCDAGLWCWYDQTRAMNADTMIPYFQAPPSPATVCAGTCTGDTVFFSGRGPFTGTLTDTYDVKISATGSPDSYQWRKNGGSYSASIPITQTFCYGNPVTLSVTDGVIICFSSTTGHTLNDVFTREAPFAGTASITGTGNNKIDSTTGQVVPNGSSGCAASNQITVLGNGTHWSTGTVTQKLFAGHQYWFEWDYANDGSNQGRFPDVAQQVLDDTHICIFGNANTWPVPVSQSATMTIQDPGTSGGNPNSFDFGILYDVTHGVSNLNFYDVTAALVRIADATNLQTYIDGATGGCNNWWQYGLDHGYRIAVPRNAAYQGMAACASWLGLNWWGTQIDTTTHTPGSGLQYQIAYNTGVTNNFNPSSPAGRDSGVDIREQGYLTRIVGIMAHVLPAHTANPAATRTAWCTYAVNHANNVWLNPSGSAGMYTLVNSNQDAYWQDNLMQTNIGFPMGGTPAGPNSSTVYGTSPWRDSGLTIIGITELYRSLANSSDCLNTPSNNFSLAASVQATAKLATDYIWTYGRDNAGGLYYNSSTSSVQGSNPNDVLHNNPSDGNGEAFNITVSGTSVTAAAGTGNFTRRFAPCNGTSRIVINMGAAIAVNSCASDDAMTLASTGGSYSGSSWYNDSTIAATNGSATIVGTRTGFTNLFAPCNGTTYIGIQGATAADNAVYQVTACADNTHLTINVNYGGTTQGTVTDYALSKQATQPAGCAPSIGTCEPYPGGQGINLANDWAVSLGQRYQWTGDATYKTQLEYALGSMLGGNINGPGFLGANAGPQSTFAPTYFDQSIPSCATTLSVQPCTLGSGHGDGDGFRGAAQYGKPFGQCAGAGSCDAAIAADLMAPNPTTITGNGTTNGAKSNLGGNSTQ